MCESCHVLMIPDDFSPCLNTYASKNIQSSDLYVNRVRGGSRICQGERGSGATVAHTLKRMVLVDNVMLLLSQVDLLQVCHSEH